jgi:hypothetical protein
MLSPEAKAFLLWALIFCIVIIVLKYLYSMIYPSQENFEKKITIPANPIFPVNMSLSCQDQNVNICDVLADPNISEKCKNYAYVLMLMRDEYQLDPNAIQMIWEEKFKNMCGHDFAKICKKPGTHTLPVFEKPMSIYEVQGEDHAPTPNGGCQKYTAP